ncbi:MAG TPA: ATP-dependent DNA ligase [Gaiellaceae bacterium]|nr:ATP-dependent DNA ligase [Gaiellaceae bacterium]
MKSTPLSPASAARQAEGASFPIGVTAPSPVTATRPTTVGSHKVADAPGHNVPFPPMEAELVSELPEHGGWRYEPKWDGFRGVLENDGGELALWSRNGRPLLRYFPELRALGELMPPHSALDGEIVISRNGALDFDAMQMRLHPAESRVRRLSAEIPATFVAFDLLLWDGKKVHVQPIEERRAELERLEGFPLSPVADAVAQGREWLQTLQAAGFDGVVAKKLGLPYMPGSRDGVVKVKPHKTADCVVAGLRWKAGGRSTIATLLLGLYADDGHLDYVGSCAVGAKNQKEIAEKVLPLLDEKSERRFSEPNRWGTNGLEEAALKPELVVEVRFDKLEKHRFRHGTRLIRFRPDKDAGQCTWREVRPARRPEDLSVDQLLS